MAVGGDLGDLGAPGSVGTQGGAATPTSPGEMPVPEIWKLILQELAQAAFYIASASA